VARLPWTLAALLAALALTGCQPGEDAPPPPPPAEPAAPTESDDSPAVAGQELASPGLDIRYLDADGQLKTLRVRDFPR